jgi:hypothetical protein
MKNIRVEGERWGKIKNKKGKRSKGLKMRHETKGERKHNKAEREKNKNTSLFAKNKYSNNNNPFHLTNVTCARAV